MTLRAITAESDPEALLAALGPGGLEMAGASLGPSLPPGEPASLGRHFAAHLRRHAAADGLCLATRAADGGLAALALYRPSPWDTAHFGVASGFLDALYCRRAEDWPEFARGLARALLERDQVFVARKTPVHLGLEMAALQEAGFRVCDTQVSLRHHGAASPSAQDGRFNVRPLAPGEDGPLAALNLEFSHDRFGGDPRISQRLARGVWEQARMNSTRGLADLVMLAEEAGRPAGMIAVQEVAPPAGGPAGGNFFLVGVAREHWGGGAFAALASAATREASRRWSWLMVETSVANYRAMNAYIKHGFNRVGQTKASLHLWLDAWGAERAQS